MPRQSFVVPVARLGAALVLSACAAGPTSTEFLPVDETGGSPGCSEGQVETCWCSYGAAERDCVGGAWDECNCAPETLPVDSTPAAFVDPTLDGSVGTSGSGEFCKAGYYTGNLSGNYSTGAFDFGFGPLVPADIVTRPTANRPGLWLTVRDDPGADHEEAAFVISDGCLEGVALAGDTEHPFFAKITGELNCETGELRAVLEGYYYLFSVPQVVYPFKGPLTANFNPALQAFDNGAWDVKEHMLNNNPPGGDGDWDAAWTGEVETAPGLPSECTQLLEGNAPAEADVVVVY